MMSPTTNQIPVVAAITSLTSYFRNPAIQAGAAKVLSKLFALAESSQLRIKDLRNLVLSRQNEDVLVATLKPLTIAARYQPSQLHYWSCWQFETGRQRCRFRS